MSWIKNNITLTCSIFLCLIFNEFTLIFSVEDKKIDFSSTLVGIRTFNIFVLLTGVCVSKKYIGKQFIVITIASLLPLILLEAILRLTPILDQLEEQNPSYIPNYLRANDADIFNNGGSLTTDGFRTWNPNTTNLLESLKSDDGCSIVILGDSFVMGDGLVASQTWPGKLKKLTSCSVYPFGVNGWTSMEQFNYYQNNLVNIKIDFLIVGIVSNDPHPRGSYCGLNYSKESYIRRHISALQPFGAVGDFIGKLSYAISYIDQVVNGTLTPLFDDKGSLESPPISTWGYSNWERRLYSEDVYEKWEQAVECFYQITTHPTAFLLTPTTVSTDQENYFSQIESTLMRLGIPHLNTYSKLQDLVGPIRSRADWANPADGHPGERQTTLYAKQAMQLLNFLGYQDY